MSTNMLPEIRPYLEQLFDEICTYAGMTVHNPLTRQRLLNYLHDQLQTFAYSRLRDALPYSARQAFTSLLERHASMETLLTFTSKHLPNLPEVMQPIFVDFRAHYLRSRAPNTLAR
jgi:hypothetical protein